MKNAKIIIIALVVLIVVLVGVIFLYVSAPKEEVTEYFLYDTGEVFVTNVLGSRALLKTHITIELTNEDTLKFCESNQFKVRDTIIGILRSKPHEILASEENTQQLKQEVLTTLSNKYELEGLENIYFNEFVIQQ